MFIKEAMIQRKEQRYRFSEPVQYELKKENRLSGAVAHDISQHGIKLEVDQFIPTHSQVAIHVQLTRMSRLLDLVGRVVWSKRVAYSDRYQLGIEFVDQSSFLKEEM